MPLNALDYAVGGAGVVTLALLYQRHSHTRALPLPPGPPRWPLVGCLFSMSQNEPTWTSFVRWGKEAGSDVIYVRVLGSDTVVLNSREAAVELLDRRSGIYSDRPRMVMGSELIGWDNMLGMSAYGERARAIRKLLHSSMNPKVMENWWPVQERETLKFLQMLSQKPENLIDHIRRTAGATVAKLTYGYNAHDEADEYIAKAESVMNTFSIATTPGAFAVDIFPSLKYFPWASFQRKAKEWRAHLVDLVNSPIEFVRERLSAGQAEPSFVSKWLEDAEEKNDETLAAWAAASLYAGGADTTVSAISTFFVAMLYYPEVQKLAQAELDRVIGKDKLPTLADRESLPYVEALYKEVLRWQPLAPIGIPHRLASDTDDEYNGMRIPANSMVIANIWSMLRDPTVYKAPETFDPSRFFGPDGENNPEDIAFGFGRRRCPGITVAQSSVWLSIALTLAAYDVTPAVGADGKPMLPSLQYSSGTVSHPRPFWCNIKPRTEQVKRLIDDAFFTLKFCGFINTPTCSWYTSSQRV